MGTNEMASEKDNKDYAWAFLNAKLVVVETSLGRLMGCQSTDIVIQSTD